MPTVCRGGWPRGARDFRGEERSTARRRCQCQCGPAVDRAYRPRRICCSAARPAERRVAVGRDGPGVGEFRADGAVVNDGADET